MPRLATTPVASAGAGVLRAAWTRVALAAAAVGGLGAQVGPAWAQEVPRVSLRFDGGRCVTGPALARGVERMLERPVFSAAVGDGRSPREPREAGAAPAVELVVHGAERSDPDGHSVVRFSLARADGAALGTRELRRASRTCGPLFDEAVVVLALLVDLGRDEVRLASSAERADVEAAAAATPAARAASPGGGHGTDRRSAPAADEGGWRRVRVELGAGAELDTRPLPRAAVGPGVEVGLALADVLVLRVSARWLPDQVAADADGRGVRLDVWSGAAALCARWSLDALAVEGCAGPVVARLGATAVALADGVDGAHASAASLRTSARLSWRAGPWFAAATLGVDVGVGTTRFLRDAGTALERELHRTADAGLVAALTLGVRLPGDAR